MTPPTPRAPLVASERVQLHQYGLPADSVPRVVLYHDVLEELLYYARYRDEDTATVLVGGHYTGPDGPYVEIQGYTSAAWMETRREWLHVLNKRLVGVIDGLRGDGDAQCVVGWSIARRGSEARLDVDDLMVHLSFFNLPHQVALLIDLEGDALALYQRAPSGALTNVGFELVSLRRVQESVAEERLTEEPLFEVEVVSEVIEEYLGADDTTDEPHEVELPPARNGETDGTTPTEVIGGDDAQDS